MNWLRRLYRAWRSVQDVSVVPPTPPLKLAEQAALRRETWAQAQIRYRAGMDAPYDGTQAVTAKHAAAARDRRRQRIAARAANPPRSAAASPPGRIRRVK